MSVIKTITPKDGIAKTPLELLQRSRDLLADEAHWVQGAMFCPIKLADNHGAEDLPEDFDVDAERERISEQIMRDGLCGDGWGVCAVGAVSLMAGLNAVVERIAAKYNPETGVFGPDTPVKAVEALVNEEGIVRKDQNGQPWAVPQDRVDRYRKAVEALNEVANDIATVPDWWTDDTVKVWGVNDEGPHIPAEWKGNTHGLVLHIFDTAIERMAAK